MLSLNWVLLLLLVTFVGEFCVYIDHGKYQIKPYSSPSSSTACAAATVQRYPFFRFYQQNKSSKSGLKFRQASNRCKNVFEAVKLAYANKIKKSITSQKRASRDF